METQASAAAGQYLTFILAGQTYGITVASIREINRLSDIAPIPHSASFVAGVMNLRGKVIAVIDLRLKFNLPAAKATKETCIIVIDSEHGQIGMIVDAVSSVIDLPQSQIEPRPTLGDDAQMSFIIGIGKIEAKVVVLVDMVYGLSGDRFALVQAVTQAAV